MIPSSFQPRVDAFLSLTDKQREVLDRLIEHKTSKEIARELDISPHTVEQRLRYSKAKLGIDRRSDLASAYRVFQSTYKEIACEDFCLPSDGVAHQMSLGAIEQFTFEEPGDSAGLSPKQSGSEMTAAVRIVPAMFEGRTGTWLRIGAIIVIAFCIIVTGLAGLAAFEQLSRLLA